MVSTSMEYVLGTILGVLVGTLGGFAGIGGAPFLVAGLTLMVGYGQHKAQGTVVAVMLGPMSLPGVLVMWDRVRLLWKYVLIGVLTYACFSYVGALLAFQFDGDGMKQLFAIFLILLGSRNVIKAVLSRRAQESEFAAEDAAAAAAAAAAKTAADDDTPQKVEDEAAPAAAAEDNKKKEDGEEETPLKAADVAVTVADASAAAVDAVKKTAADANDESAEATALVAGDVAETPPLRRRGSVEINLEGLTYSNPGKWQFSLLASGIMGVIVGTVGGLFGIGAGVLMVPLMTTVWGVHKDDARAISLAMLCPPVSAGAVIRYQQDGDIEWIMVAIQFATYILTNYYGAKAGKKVNSILFGQVLGAMLLVLGILIFAISAQDCDGFCF